MRNYVTYCSFKCDIVSLTVTSNFQYWQGAGVVFAASDHLGAHRAIGEVMSAGDAAAEAAGGACVGWPHARGQQVTAEHPPTQEPTTDLAAQTSFEYLYHASATLEKNPEFLSEVNFWPKPKSALACVEHSSQDICVDTFPVSRGERKRGLFPTLLLRRLASSLLEELGSNMGVRLGGSVARGRLPRRA
jgi:hypothetical protein